MSKAQRICIILLATLGGSAAAFGRTIIYAGKVETVMVPVGAETIVRFDKPVKTVTNATAFVIRPASENSPDYTTLIVEARTSRATSFVTFVLADGQVVRTKLVAGTKLAGEAVDNVYDFKVDDAQGGPESGVKAPELKAVELMKAMIRGDKVMGYEVREPAKVLLTGMLGVRAELVKLYTGGDFNGYVIRLKNVSGARAYTVDIRSLRFGEPNLAVLSQVDRRVLENGDGETSEAYLRVVARPGSVYRDMVLPVGLVTKKDKEAAL